jgi:hypothetical protein
MFSVGAAFDYEAGVQRTAPRWTGRLGLEWLFRLAADPRRLFRRYCVEPWFLIGRAINDVLILSSKRRNPATLSPFADGQRNSSNRQPQHLAPIGHFVERRRHAGE